MDIQASGSRGDGALNEIKIKRRELFLELKNEQFYKFSSSKCNEQLVKYILDKYGDKVTEKGIEQIQLLVKIFVSKVLSKWRESNYMLDRFNMKHMKWLGGELQLSEVHLLHSVPEYSEQNRRGKPRQLFEDSSLRSKQRSIRPLVDDISVEKLCLAAESSLVKSGRRTAAQVVKSAFESTPRKLKKMKLIHNPSSSSAMITPYTPEEALGLIVDLGLTKEDYLTLRLGAKGRGANIYPSYHVIAEAKSKCYPANIKISENEAVVPLMDLLEHTVHRLDHVQADVILQNLSDDCDTIQVYYKWGLDGSGGHSIYKQNLANNSEYADSNIILITIVPLEMCQSSGSTKRIYWKNTTPSSGRYCRPIGFMIKKENIQNMKEEFIKIQTEILHLELTTIVMGDKEIKFKHIPICTMVDGKTVNILTDTSSTRACNVCKATPKDLNDLEKLRNRDFDDETFKYGISVLHAHLRCFEYLLHIAYKFELQQWQARGEDAKEKVTKKKSEIATEFYKQMGLVVDQPKQGGGNSNDGNTARKFFKNPSLVSQITGIDKGLIERFSNILSIISCGHYVKEDTFKEYCFETAQQAISLYGWYKMSASVHKLLIHGADIIKSLPLPVGQLSEDAIEAGHKEYKNLRRHHSRKTSRTDTNRDIFNWILVSSDPIVTNNRKKPKKIKTQFNQVVLSMLRPPPFCVSDGELSGDQWSDSDDDGVVDEDVVGDDNVYDDMDDQDEGYRLMFSRHG